MKNSIPFENVQKDSAVIKQVIQGELPSVTDHVRMSLILQLSSIIKQCWSINPSKRPTAGEFRKSMGWMASAIAGVSLLNAIDVFDRSSR